MSDVIVRRQTELGGRNWGVYVDGKCVEGGFFDFYYASDCADEWEASLAKIALLTTALHVKDEQLRESA